MNENPTKTQTDLAPAPAAEVENEVPDFDINAAPDIDQPDTDGQADPGGSNETDNPGTDEYALDLTGLDDEDVAYREIFTRHAKDCGLDAKSASKFIVGFTKAMHELHGKQDAEAAMTLRKEWGADFESKKMQTLSFMKNLFTRAGLTEDEVSMFANAKGVRIGRKLMGIMGRSTQSKVPQMPANYSSRQSKIDELVVQLVQKQADFQTPPNEIAKIKSQINSIAGMRLY